MKETFSHLYSRKINLAAVYKQVERFLKGLCLGPAEIACPGLKTGSQRTKNTEWGCAWLILENSTFITAFSA